MSSTRSTPVLALTVGDPVGIGPEITVRTLAEYAGAAGHHGVAVGDAAACRRAVEATGLDVEVREVTGFDTAPAGEGVIDVLDIGVLGEEPLAWGEVDAAPAGRRSTAIEVATRAALAGEVDGVVTGPINKEAIWASGSEHLGHTEMLGELTGSHEAGHDVRGPLAADPDHHLRIFFATRHVSLRKALDQLTHDRAGRLDPASACRRSGCRRGLAPAGRRRAQPARR